MPSYATTITVVNRTGSEITITDAVPEPTNGTWVLKPIDIPATDPSANVFHVHPSPTNADGSQGVVNYTVQNATQDKINVRYACNDQAENTVNVTGTTSQLKITYALTKPETDAAYPLVNVVYIDKA